MLNMTLGTGIAWASLFLALGTVLVVYINNTFQSKRSKNNPTSENSFVRRGEHNQAIESFHRRLDDIQKENKNWWKQLNEKMDNIQSELSRLRKTNEDQGQRISVLETKQRE